MALKTGKLELEAVERLILGGLGAARSDVVVGPRVGVDCAVVDAGGSKLVVLKSDPITFATDRVGWYAVHVNANDVVTSGADPAWFLSTVLVPPTSCEEDVADVFRQIRSAALTLGVAVVGGHTEVTPAVTQVVVGGTMVGLVDRDRLLLPDTVQPGDVLVATKGAAVEATAIVAAAFPEVVRHRTGEALLARAAAFLDEPGISVVPEARLLRDLGVRAMHDATEGGVRAAALEVGLASGCGVSLDEDAVPVDDVTRRVCAAVGIDPMGAISSGCLLAVLPPDRLAGALAALRDQGIVAAACGEFLGRGAPSVRVVAGREQPFPYQPRDEVARLFDEGPPA